ncbi:single-stranded-DNA-specific exonuclease RecJ [Phycisphaerales bacterium AB-hyl4]|uniref:Single-stranded-DNA-specific exonuclease RecJ n=1 Tax=Natronomicrosphaera hydrolytica TaxID=3242702 RepID=A0ABV4U5I2_9BACT
MTDAGMRKRWRSRSSGSFQSDDPQLRREQAVDFAGKLGMSPLIAELLLARGVDTSDAARAFLKPTLNDLADPAELPGVPEAARRIARAVADGQPIVIYGDYDVDGVTAASVLWHTLRLADADVSIYIPHRVDEGYGLNEDAIRSFAELSPQPLVVTVDCGITATGPADLARELGLDLIITDHHTFDPADLPNAHALVHPGLADAGGAVAVGAADLCGAGVAFKLAWQVAREICGSDRLPAGFRDLLVNLLTLVALGTVADVVPLRGENRVLTRFGLARIKNTGFAGLDAMIDAAQLRDERIDSYHVGFVLGPRLNACGRMGHAREAARLLTEAVGDEARELAVFLNSENDRRRATERTIAEQAAAQVREAGYDAADRRAIVVAGEDWHPGVVGIVASRLVEQFSRPVIVLNIDEEGIAHGSARSVDGVSIHEALTACREHLTRFGGHAMAAGLALRAEAIGAFRDALVTHVNEKLTVEQLTPVLTVDAALSLGDCTLALFEQLQELGPFGRDNPRPKLLVRDVTLDGPARPMGRQGQHLQLRLRQGGSVMRAVAFNFGDVAEQLPGGVELDVVFEAKLGQWQGRRTLDLHVQDLRPKRRTPATATLAEDMS